MNKEDLWKLFTKTGDLNYYIKYKEMTSKGIDRLGDNESKGNNIK